MTRDPVGSTKYFFLILASTFLQGSSFVSTKVVLMDMAPLWAAALRFFIAALSLSPLACVIMRRQGLRLRCMPWLQLVTIGLLQTTGVMAFLNIGLMSTTASTAAILMASNPLLVVILARLFLGERVPALALLGLVLAFAGVVVCIGTGGGYQAHVIRHGEGLVMLASICWASSTVLNKRFNLEMSPWVITFWQMLIGSAILGVVACIYGQPLSWPSSPFHWLAFAWLAIPASTGAMGLWFAALRIGGSVQTSGFLFLCPLFASVIAFGLTQQTPQQHEIAGGALIGFGLYAMSRRQRGCPSSIPLRPSGPTSGADSRSEPSP